MTAIDYEEAAMRLRYHALHDANSVYITEAIYTAIDALQDKRDAKLSEMNANKILESLKTYSLDYLTYKIDAEFAQAVSNAVTIIEQLVDFQNSIQNKEASWEQCCETWSKIDMISDVADCGESECSSNVNGKCKYVVERMGEAE